MPHVSLSDLPDDEQGAILAERLGADGLDRILGRQDRGETIDGATVQRALRGPVTALPKMATASASDARYKRDRDGERYVELGASVEVVDDHVSTPEEMIEAEDARRSRRAGDSYEAGTFEGVAECQANRVTHERGGGKGTGKAKPLRGKTTDELHEQLLMSGDGSDNRKRPMMGSGRITKEAYALLYRPGEMSVGEILEAFAGAMQRTGKSAAEVLSSIETGCFDPDLVDAVEPPPRTSVA